MGMALKGREDKSEIAINIFVATEKQKKSSRCENLSWKKIESLYMFPRNFPFMGKERCLVLNDFQCPEPASRSVL